MVASFDAMTCRIKRDKAGLCVCTAEGWDGWDQNKMLNGTHPAI
jgi:hypothetical protein